MLWAVESLTPSVPPYLPRLASRALARDLAAFPVAVLTGARQTGKSTLAVESDTIPSRTYLTLDDLSVREQASRAPLDLLERAPRLTIDEAQREPDLLLALKAIVDRERPRRPGRFLVTGSANLLLMRSVADSLAGRAGYRVLHPMTRREQLGHARAGLWGELVVTPVAQWPELLAADGVGDADWRGLARRGGFPVPALELSAEARGAWFEGYVRTYLERDLRDLANIQSLPDFRRLMRAVALRQGSLMNQSEVARDVGMPQPTVHRHLGLLETSHLLVRLEPYAVNRTKRLIKAPKLYVADTGLALSLSGGEPTGAHLESLVIHDLRAWADAEPAPRPEVLYWRTASGQEVDAVIELQDGRLMAVEVKATRTPRLKDARHLRAFRDEYGDAVIGGLLLHDGADTFRLEDRVVAAPWWRVL
ncbi:MAG: ATP-binding protein [Myxococcales bacterium]|nr:ATP-binding protein [Myxococcales bacterium]